MALTIEEQVKAIQDEIDKTQKNKATEYHIGKLKAKLAKLRDEVEKRRTSSGGPAKGYSVKKSGNATVALVGFPSVGKSTLLNILTGAKSEVGSYDFTTIDVVPGAYEYQGAKIQVLDMPGLIRDAAKGKGRGREGISVVRASDLVLFVLDFYDTNLQVLVRELENAGMRINTHPPDVVISRREIGGVDVKTTVKLTKIDMELAKAMIVEYGLVNADVVIREDVDQDQLVDVLSGNRIYISAVLAVNKIDISDETYLKEIRKKFKNWDPVFISAVKDIGIDELKAKIFHRLELIRVYMKKQGEDADLNEPLIAKNGSTVGDVCDSLHRIFRLNFRYALVWGKSARFPGQMVGLEHKLADGDVLSVIYKRTGE
ncbi:MAG: GTP-binding protein [Methanomassiliicoccus sp.]|nr:MAG: GTP-binding protein [Methanomassiliicoccus sp.]